MALYSIVPNAEMTERFDSEFYTPDFLLNDKKLRGIEHQPLSEILIDLQLGYTGPTEKFYELNGINYLSSKNVIDGTIEITDATDTISRGAHKNALSKTAVKEGDVLITRTGTVGKSAVVTQYLGEANIAAHLIALRIKPSWDSYYICGFLNSSHGRKQSKRHQRGTIIQGLSVFDIPQFVIPKYEQQAQKYIGDKVRQAEQLRAWANRCRQEIKEYYDGLFTGISLTKPEHQHTRVSLDILVPRLNAEYYSDHYTLVEKGLLSRFGKLTTLDRLAPTVRAKIKPSTDCIYKEIGDLDVNKGAFSSGTFYKFGEAPNNAQRVFDEGDVAVSTRRPNRGAITVIDESSSKTFYSVFLARLKPKDKNFGYWLKEFLRHDAGKLLLLQRCTWTTYPVISEDDIETIPVPEIPNDWGFVARLSRQSVRLEAYATKLTTSAKTLVEALIEGQLTEQQLVQTQQALDDGDNSLDQAILSKLSSEGYAIEGATPLFSDIDELYRLLENAAQAEVEE